MSIRKWQLSSVIAQIENKFANKKQNNPQLEQYRNGQPQDIFMIASVLSLEWAVYNEPLAGRLLPLGQFAPTFFLKHILFQFAIDTFKMAIRCRTTTHRTVSIHLNMTSGVRPVSSHWKSDATFSPYCCGAHSCALCFCLTLNLVNLSSSLGLA